jgi:hypothetical protein
MHTQFCLEEPETLEPRQGNTFSIFVIGGTYKELETIFFDKLSEGADKDKRTFIEIHNMQFGATDNSPINMAVLGFLREKK